MGKFIRIAMMFGPMIYKGIQKLMAKRNESNQPPPADGQEPEDLGTR